jgi:hypothetical protein
MILGSADPIRNNVFLFYHGTFITSVTVPHLNRYIALCIDAKKDLFDLQVSKENIVNNKAYSTFLISVYARA